MRFVGRLRGRSLAEIRLRLRQLAQARVERARLALGLPAVPDALTVILRDGVSGDPEQLRDRFCARVASVLPGGTHDPVATARSVRTRWPREADAVRRRADRICQGLFDLLGHTELRFGAPLDWHLDPVRQVTSPRQHWSAIRYLDPRVVGDHKLVWELNRHQWLVTLGQAWADSGESRYADVAAGHLERWLDANPPAIGVNWVSSLEVAYRSIAWLWCIALLRDSGALSPALFARLLQSLHVHARHIESYLSTYFSPNTHLTGEALGLFYIGTCCPDLRGADRWRKLGVDILSSQLARQVGPDGVYFEHASYYHRYALEIFLHWLVLARASGQPPPVPLESALRGLSRHLVGIQRPDGMLPLLGDDDGGRVLFLDVRPGNDPQPALGAAAVVLGCDDARFGSRGQGAEATWLLGPTVIGQFDSVPARPSLDRSVAYPARGLFVMRDDWTANSDYLVVDCGARGRLNEGHAHADVLGIELAVNGCPALVDPGTFTYTVSRELRDHFRHSRSHNTLVVDGISSSTMEGAFSWSRMASGRVLAWASTARFDYLHGTHDGYEALIPPVRYSRAILRLHGDYWVLFDVVLSTGRHRVEVILQGARGLGLAVTSGRRIRLSDGARVTLDVTTEQCDAGGAYVAEVGWVSTTYGHREASPRAVWAAETSGNHEILSILAPGGRPGTAPWVCRRLASETGLLMEMRRGERADLIAVGGAQLPGLEHEGLIACQSMARADFPQELLVVEARRCRLDGAELVTPEHPVTWIHVTDNGRGRVVERGEPMPRTSPAE